MALVCVNRVRCEFSCSVGVTLRSRGPCLLVKRLELVLG